MTKPINTTRSIATFVSSFSVWVIPMNRKDYNDFRGWQVPSDENPNNDGYLVINPNSPEKNVSGFNGYVSWSPKAVFEKSYKPCSTPIERMQIELDELHERMDKLGAFISKPKPDFLDDNEWALLHEQAEHMAQYYNVLNTRLAIAKSKQK